MKVAIYGVSASGKDHLISDLVAYLDERGVGLTHIPGSVTLNTLAQGEYGQTFSALEECEKAKLRTHFADGLTLKEQECGNVVVDGHFAFYAGDSTFVDVFTDSDLAAYDLFFYLDTDPKIVAKRLLSQGRPMTEEDVSRWQNYEVNGLTRRLLEVGRELHVIRDDGEPTLQYIKESIEGKWSSHRIAEQAIEGLGSLAGPGVVCLVDCDKTLIEEDAIALLLRHGSVDVDELASIYRRDRYTNYQCFMARRWLDMNLKFDDADIQQTFDEITPNRGLLDSLAHRADIPVVAISASPTMVWQPLLNHLGVSAEILDTQGAMSKYVKYFATTELQKRGCFVVAIGDSMLDSLMLEVADRSYVYAGKGKRESVARLLESNPHIRQFSFCDYQYPGSAADRGVCLVDCLDGKNQEVCTGIAVCRSSSGVMGRELRDAHRRLGALLGQRISNCLAGEELVVVVMMRSGLPLGEGIADTLDCPMLFFNGNADDLLAQIREDGLGSRRLILTDGVVNTGKSLADLVDNLRGFKLAVAASVVSSRAHFEADYPVFSVRVSDNSYVGARQWDVASGKGPDTADRLFRTM